MRAGDLEGFLANPGAFCFMTSLVIIGIIIHGAITGDKK